MASVSKALLSFSATLLPWQQDALRRAATLPVPLSDQDIQELANMALGDPAAPIPKPLSTDDFDSAHESGESVVLSRLHSVKNANALMEGQVLEFARMGLTVIYGENGSGKSGYSRILRRVCRARKAPAILPNVRHPRPGLPEAAFDVRTVTAGMEQQVTLTWKEGDQRPGALARFLVFDRDCEQDIVDGEAEATFTPAGLAVLRHVADVMGHVQSAIHQRAAGIQRVDLAQLRTATAGNAATTEILAEAAGSVTGPKANQLRAKLAALMLSEEDLKKLSHLESQLKEPNPTIQAGQARTMAQSILRKVNDLQLASTSLGDPTVEGLRAAFREREAADQAARLVEQRSNLNEIAITAPGVGGEAWRLLYGAAEAYAVQHLHPGVPFGAAASQDRCPLCLQSLGEEAKAHFERFHAYMDRTTRARSTSARSAFEQRMATIAQLRAVADRSFDDLLRQSNLDQYVAAHGSAIAKIIARRDAIVAGAQAGSWEGLPELPDEDLAVLTAASAEQAVLATALTDASNVQKRQEMQEQVDRLRARKALMEGRQTVLDAIEAEEKRTRILGVAGGITTRTVTDANKRIAEDLLRKGLGEALDAELQALGVKSRLSVNLGHKGRAGQNLFKLHMDGVSGAKCSAVWSEGEQRAVGLAFFLAEAAIAPTKVGIILDDPACSLSHRWQGRIAARLAEVAENRQVIVFTHSLTFLDDLCLESEELRGKPVSKVFLRNGPTGAGLVEMEPTAWEVMAVGARINELRRRLKQARDLFGQDQDSPEYRTMAGGILSDLRPAWERAVEEVVFNGVVTRFCREVKTLKMEKVNCTSDDHQRVFASMKKLSAKSRVHDAAAAAGRAPLNPDEILELIDELDHYVQEKRRQGKALKDGG